MKLMELFQHLGKDVEANDDIDWLGDLKFYIDNNDHMLEQHIFPAMKQHQKHAGKKGTYKFYIKPVQECLRSYVKEYEIQNADQIFTNEVIEEIAKHFAQTQENFINRGDYTKVKIHENSEKHVTFVFGRLNPPTLGHKKLLDSAAKGGGDYKIFISKSQDKKKNPLDYEEKLHYVKTMFPEHAKAVVDEHPNQLPHIAVMLYEAGYKSVTFVAGSDRIEFMGPMLQKYNGEENKHGFYKFDSIDYRSSGDREDGAEGVEGISASNARAAAADGDFEKFKESVGNFVQIDSMYEAVRAGMGITEEFGVGRITKQNTTKDVKPGEEKRQMRKFKL